MNADCGSEAKQEGRVTSLSPTRRSVYTGIQGLRLPRHHLETLK